jgi:hypothetical protein
VVRVCLLFEELGSLLNLLDEVVILQGIELLFHVLDCSNLADNAFDDTFLFELFPRMEVGLLGVLGSAGPKPVYHRMLPQYVVGFVLRDSVQQPFLIFLLAIG